MARSPDENDKTELLKEAEPIDYTGELSSAADTDFSQGYQRSSTLRSNRFGSRTAYNIINEVSEKTPSLSRIGIKQ